MFLVKLTWHGLGLERESEETENGIPVKEK